MNDESPTIASYRREWQQPCVQARGPRLRVGPVAYGLLLLALLAAFALTGCGAQQDYVRADRATYEAVAPAMQAIADGDLEPATPKGEVYRSEVYRKALRLKLRSWKARIDRAEGAK